MRLKRIILLFITLAAANSASSDVNKTDTFSAYVDAEGNISKPDGFRTDWEHLGSWFIPADEHAQGPGFHDVYASPGTAAAFKQTGEFPDGAVLVKEIRGIESKEHTTGNAHWAGDTGVWFVMVKDTQNRFPDNKSWGEGWGWALFKADNPSLNVTTNWKGEGLNNCYGCHLPAQQTDWVYVEGYPTLR